MFYINSCVFCKKTTVAGRLRKLIKKKKKNAVKQILEKFKKKNWGATCCQQNIKSLTKNKRRVSKAFCGMFEDAQSGEDDCADWSSSDDSDMEVES